MATLLTGLSVAASLALSGRAFMLAAQALALAYLPLACLEGLMTATVVAFLARVEPHLLVRESTGSG
jgi:cobalt/nickel transport system permease protein